MFVPDIKKFLTVLQLALCKDLRFFFLLFCISPQLIFKKVFIAPVMKFFEKNSHNFAKFLQRILGKNNLFQEILQNYNTFSKKVHFRTKGPKILKKKFKIHLC